ncbi:MAG TPA: cyclic nucleotide-binding domain-containing protein [Gammaproteobacteria bacterium]|nr:cyclic nucleotide-binding domain-containing protein [Gammaproteobacteria bacterium]
MARRQRSAFHRPEAGLSALLGLQKIDVLKGLDARTLRQIADRCKWTRYERNEYVIRRDGADRNVHFVIAGMLRITAEAGRGRRIIFRDVPAGDLFGEHSAIDGKAHFADVLAVQESLLASVPSEAFRALLAHHASIRERVLRRLTHSVRDLADRILDLGAKPVPWRIWVELLRLARKFGVKENSAHIRPFPKHREIASVVGTSREQVARELSRLDREGLVERDGQVLVLRNVEALEGLLADSRIAEDSSEELPIATGSGTAHTLRQRRALVVADALNAVGMMERDEERTVQRWRAYFAHATAETIQTHAGRSFSSVREQGFVAEFPDGAQALRCAFDLHRALARLNAEVRSAPLGLRIGIHVADVMVEEFNLVGDGVNIAAGLAELANSGETVISVQVRDQLTSGLDASIEDLGEQRLRNRERPIRSFRVWPSTETARLAPSAAVQAHGRPSVAVVPFQLRTSDPRLEFAGDGLADETIASLSQVADFFVVSRLSSMAFRRAPLSVRSVGEMLGVQYVLSGSIQTVPGRALLLAELADTRDGRILWTERFACGIADVLAMQEELARAVVKSVAPFVRSFELRRARITNFEQLDAYAITLRGIDLMHRMSREDFIAARGVLEAAIERNPVSPAPHAWLAKWHVLRMANGASDNPMRDREAATACAERALECDPKDALALAVDAHVAAWARNDLDAAERRLSEAISSNPSEPLAWLWNAMVHAWRGRGAEAMQCAERALSLSPLDPMMYYFHSLASTANLVGGCYERAIEFAERSLRENRLHTPTLRTLAVAQVLSKRIADARQTVIRVRELEPRLTVTVFRARYPGRDSPQFEKFAAALHAAGLPK